MIFLLKQCNFSIDDHIFEEGDTEDKITMSQVVVPNLASKRIKATNQCLYFIMLGQVAVIQKLSGTFLKTL